MKKHIDHTDLDALRLLDILGFAVGLVYLWLEYRASIYLWVASIVMPAIDMVLYLKAGLYADFAMTIYYCLAAVYGFAAWRGGSKDTDGKSPVVGISHFPLRRVAPTVACGLAVWGIIYWVLATFTNSSVPVTDAFTTALSIVALWALARRYAEQWLLWLVVDAVCCALYVYKDIPFKASIYGLYTVVAVFGYRKWLALMAKEGEGSGAS